MKKLTVGIIATIALTLVGCKKVAQNVKQQPEESIEQVQLNENGLTERQQVQFDASTTDAQLFNLLEEYGKTRKYFGFSRYRNEPAQDVWGTPVQLSYHQEWLTEYFTITSAGEDKTFDTVDDIATTKSATSFLTPTAAFLFACTSLAYGCFYVMADAMRSAGKGYAWYDHLLALVICFIFGPLIVIPMAFYILPQSISRKEQMIPSLRISS